MSGLDDDDVHWRRRQHQHHDSVDDDVRMHTPTHDGCAAPINISDRPQHDAHKSSLLGSPLCQLPVISTPFPSATARPGSESFFSPIAQTQHQTQQTQQGVAAIPSKRRKRKGKKRKRKAEIPDSSDVKQQRRDDNQSGLQHNEGQSHPKQIKRNEQGRMQRVQGPPSYSIVPILQQEGDQVSDSVGTQQTGGRGRQFVRAERKNGGRPAEYKRLVKLEPLHAGFRIANLLRERNKTMIFSIVNSIGVPAAIELLKQTHQIEDEGGLKLPSDVPQGPHLCSDVRASSITESEPAQAPSGSKQSVYVQQFKQRHSQGVRTPGGVYIQLARKSMNAEQWQQIAQQTRQLAKAHKGAIKAEHLLTSMSIEEESEIDRFPTLPIPIPNPTAGIGLPDLSNISDFTRPLPGQLTVDLSTAMQLHV